MTPPAFRGKRPDSGRDPSTESPASETDHNGPETRSLRQMRVRCQFERSSNRTAHRAGERWRDGRRRCPRPSLAVREEGRVRCAGRFRAQMFATRGLVLGLRLFCFVSVCGGSREKQTCFQAGLSAGFCRALSLWAIEAGAAQPGNSQPQLAEAREGVGTTVQLDAGSAQHLGPTPVSRIPLPWDAVRFMHSSGTAAMGRLRPSSERLQLWKSGDLKVQSTVVS